VFRSRLIPEYGGSSREVRVLYESVPGQVTVKASGSVSERPPIKGCNDVAVDGLGQACCFLASLCLPFALYVGMRTKKQPMRHHALLPQKFRWHKYGKPEVRADSRKVGPFIQACRVPLTL
jgi:hypothetical protein